MRTSASRAGNDRSVGSSVLEAIHERRATRAFTSQRVSDSRLRQLLDAAIWAPSANNLQPWSFVIIQDRTLLTKISGDTRKLLADDPHWRTHLPLSDPDFDIFYGCGTLIVICANAGGFNPVGDCYLAGQNLMLAAWSLDLASCPVGLAREILQTEALKQQLRIPRGINPVLPIIVGYASHAMPKTERHAPHLHAWIK